MSKQRYKWDERERELINAEYKRHKIGRSAAERKTFWFKVHGIMKISHVKTNAEFVFAAEYLWLHQQGAL